MTPMIGFEVLARMPGDGSYPWYHPCHAHYH